MFGSSRRSRGMAIRPTNKGIKYKERQTNRAKTQRREQENAAKKYLPTADWIWVAQSVLIIIKIIFQWCLNGYYSMILSPCYYKSLLCWFHNWNMTSFVEVQHLIFIEDCGCWWPYFRVDDVMNLLVTKNIRTQILRVNGGVEPNDIYKNQLMICLNRKQL